MVAYATVDQLKIRVNMTAALTAAKTTAYEEILDAMSRKIDGVCRRPDGFVSTAADETRYFDGKGKHYLRVPECTSITLVSVKASYLDTAYVAWTTPTTVLAGDGDWYPVAGSHSRPIFNRTPYTLLLIDPNGDYSGFPAGGGLPTVEIAAKWGYATTAPSPIREATLAETARLIKRFEASMGGRTADGNLGALVMSVRQAALSKDIRDLLVNSMFVLPLYAGE